MKITLLLVVLLVPSILFSKDYIIFSIAQDITLDDNHTPGKKNYYVNIGGQQGVREGTVLNVYRIISRLDPYEGKTRFNFNVKIGRLKVLHVEDTAAITQKEDFLSGNEYPIFEIDDFMIGDNVKVDVGKN